MEMKKRKDVGRITQILKKGEVTFLDPDSGYRYSLGAVCPNDSLECSLTSCERESGEYTKIVRTTFYCPICGTRFDASPETMFLR
jgi:hypothetical protein